jgi:ABC-type multidrug transport system ATPase subunit
MHIKLTEAGKRFRFDWIFRGMTCALEPGQVCAVLGPNGSGKSTLLKVLAGHLSLSKGAVSWTHEGRQVAPEACYRQVSYAAPYIELIEEFTLGEAIDFHVRLKPLVPNMAAADLLDLLELGRARDKQIRFFSSGMKQRLKLGLAIFSDTPLLLLDEPTTNLDTTATAWFHRLLAAHTRPDRLVVVASNDPSDLSLCNRQISISDFK